MSLQGENACPNMLTAKMFMGHLMQDGKILFLHLVLVTRMFTLDWAMYLFQVFFSYLCFTLYLKKIKKSSKHNISLEPLGAMTPSISRDLPWESPRDAGPRHGTWDRVHEDLVWLPASSHFWNLIYPWTLQLYEPIKSLLIYTALVCNQKSPSTYL